MAQITHLEMKGPSPPASHCKDRHQLQEHLVENKHKRINTGDGMVIQLTHKQHLRALRVDFTNIQLNQITQSS